jgi:hypothetical protein
MPLFTWATFILGRFAQLQKLRGISLATKIMEFENCPWCGKKEVPCPTLPNCSRLSNIIARLKCHFVTLRSFYRRYTDMRTLAKWIIASRKAIEECNWKDFEALTTLDPVAVRANKALKSDDIGKMIVRDGHHMEQNVRLKFGDLIRNAEREYADHEWHRCAICNLLLGKTEVSVFYLLNMLQIKQRTIEYVEQCVPDIYLPYAPDRDVDRKTVINICKKCLADVSKVNFNFMSANKRQI